MAVNASFYHDDGFVALNLHSDQRRPRVEADPELPGYDPGDRIWLYWDDEAFAAGERVFLGVEINDIGWLREEDLVALDRLGLPRIDVPEAGLFDVTVSDALRWARRRYPSRYSGVS